MNVGKNHLPLRATLTEVDPTGTKYSIPLDVSTRSDVAIVYQWTSTLSGTITFEGSVDYLPPVDGLPGSTPRAAGMWTGITPSPTITSPNGSNAASSPLTTFITATPYFYIRAKYVHTSGTGTLTVKMGAK